jgi:subtilisin family serine protease
VASSGNVPDDDDVLYPAAYDGVIAAAAVTRTGERAEISVRGDRLVLAAPGDDITSTRPGGTYATAKGTSDASAIISGVAALVKAKFPNISGKEIYHRLTATADDKGLPGRDADYGFGIVNPVRALTADVPPLAESPSPHPDASPQAQPSATGDTGLSTVLTGLLIVAVIGLLLVATIVLIVVLVYRRSRTSNRQGAP